MSKTTVNIYGKEYETVASRVNRFKLDFTSLAIVTKLLERDDTMVVMKASIIDPEGRVLATGHAEERRDASTINKTSALENCETSAIGRALAAFGLAGTEFASADEVAQAISQQGGSVASTQLTGIATDKQKDLIAKKLNEQGIANEDIKGHLIEQYGVEIPLTKEGAGFVLDDLLNNMKTT